MCVITDTTVYIYIYIYIYLFIYIYIGYPEYNFLGAMISFKVADKIRWKLAARRVLLDIFYAWVGMNNSEKTKEHLTRSSVAVMIRILP